jgi:hypothetical protein
VQTGKFGVVELWAAGVIVATVNVPEGITIGGRFDSLESAVVNIVNVPRRSIPDATLDVP